MNELTFVMLVAAGAALITWAAITKDPVHQTIGGLLAYRVTYGDTYAYEDADGD